MSSLGPFFGGPFFSGGLFGELQDDEIPKTGGKGDNKRKRKAIYKPTGLPPYRKPVEQRLQETHEIAREVIAQEPRMSLSEVEEIGTLLHKKMKTEEEEIVLLLLAVSVAG
jgi:hypothetical protein